MTEGIEKINRIYVEYNKDVILFKKQKRIKVVKINCRKRK